ncbi:MAG TPA: FMN reductase [Erwinia sp.]|uniref:NADPH-dependent FMN reductase n=1 Tax=Erwinia citreus TaxID=558 RepID=UPI000E96D3F6|nr:NADPH-dependent FMN reductase [Erwinia sp.]HBV39658.1 FMN reductase [Erwinia sp.]
MSHQPRILAVAGSLRGASVNHLFLRTLRLIKPANIDFKIYSELGSLPLFNADNDEHAGEEVGRWRKEIADADMLLLVSPEYAHGVSGVMKNALDWIVGSGELMEKRLAFPNLSVRATLAQAQLTEMLHILGCRLLEDCSPQATPERPLMLPAMDEQSLLADKRTGPELKKLWLHLEHALLAEPENQPGHRAGGDLWG